MICPNCGATNEDNALQCAQCLTVLKAELAPGAGGPPVVIPNYLWQAILCTVCCCIPLGIPAIVYAAQVNTKIAQGDLEGARQSSKNARMWCWIAFGLGLGLTLVYSAVMLISTLSHMR